MSDGGQRRIEESAARDTGLSDDADVVGNAQSVFFDGADDSERGIVAHRETACEGRAVPLKVVQDAVEHFAAGSLSGFDVAVGDLRFDSVEACVIQETAVAAFVPDAPWFGENQCELPVSVPNEALCRGHTGVFRLGINRIDTVTEQVVLQKDDRCLHAQNGGDFLLGEVVDRECEENDIALDGIQKFQIIPP